VQTVLALDLGTNTGWALGSQKGKGVLLISGVFRLKPGRFDSASMRFVRFLKQLNELADLERPDLIVFEEVRAHKGVDAAHVYGGLMAHLQVWATDRDIPFEGVSVGAIKKYATGRGNAPKDAMLEAVKSWGYRPADDNEADAIALLRLKLAELNDPA
jgi:Holliday junction resolvasome RuvABC endonuclease subunit